MKIVSMKSALLAGAAFTALQAAPAFAQDAEQSADDQAQAPGAAPAEATEDDSVAQGEDIVVTGTLIRNPNLEQSTPVNVTTSDTIELKQSNLAE